MKASRTDPIIKRILAATYPEYKGRKIRVDGHGSICDCQAFEQQMCERCGQVRVPDGWAFWDGDRVVPCESYEAVVAAIRKAKGER